MLVLKSDYTILAQKVEVANNFYKRFIGLLLKKDIQEDYALILMPCQGVHTFFMKFSIDVICLNQDKIVCAIYTDLTRNKVITPSKQYYYIIEMKAQNINKKIALGDEVVW